MRRYLRQLLCLLPGLASTLGAACSTPQMPPVPPPPVTLPSDTGPPPAPASRALPGFRPSADQPGYPPAALEQGLTGRVLVEFHIDPNGRATAITVAKAQADAMLQRTAVAIIAAQYFDVRDPAYNATDPRPFFASVQFCLDYCGELRPFPGYERNALIITAARNPGALLR